MCIRDSPSTVDLLLKKLSSNEKLSKYSDAVMTLHDVLLYAEKTGLVRMNERAIEWNGKSEAQKLQLERFLDEYRINTERMHDLALGTQNSGWRDLIPTKRTNNTFLDNFILASETIWHAIQTNQLHLRNDVGMQILTGKGMQGTQQVMYLNEQLNNRYFKGKRKLRLKEGEESLTEVGENLSLIHI